MLNGAPFAEIARALDLPDLRTVTLPLGAQELRLTDWYPMVYGSPVPLLRIARFAGQTEVQLYIWRGARDDSTAATEADNDIHCGPPGDPRRVCVEGRALGLAVDWDSLTVELTGLGPCEGLDQGHVADGGELLLQVLDGETYRLYECNAPGMRSSPDGRRAAQAMDLLGRLARSARGR